MRAERAVTIPLAGTAALLVAVAFATPAVAKEHRKEVYLYKKSGTCTHEVDETTFKISKTWDHSKWDVSNDGMPHGTDACGTAQYVILCTYRKAGTVYVHDPDVFKKCNSQPQGLNMNTAFQLDAGHSATLVCKADKTQYTKFSAKVAVDSGPSAPTCRAILPPQSEGSSGGVKLLYHVIDIEVVP
jgi:hypothetical protein